MRLILSSKLVYIMLAAVLVILAIIFLIGATTGDEGTLVTTKVERGDVTELVSVSGVVEAENNAELAFPVSGIVKEVMVREGDDVERGTVLARLEQAALQADHLDAVAAVQTARANRDELVAGPREESRDITKTTVGIKEDLLEQTKREEEQKIANALRTLLSSDLEAVSTDPNEDAVAPTITGTYSCLEEGVYELSIYSSGARSGYSFTLRGLESGTYPVTTDQPLSFGNCGLRIQFDADSVYSNSEWTIAIPNQESSSYVTNVNAYDLAKEQAENAIASAEQTVTLATQEAILANANPRIEALQRANAAVAQAEARLAKVNAQIADRTLTAPFSGEITDVSVIAGETVTSAPVITLLAQDSFDLTARIPEIDIAKVVEGQRAEVVFDARSGETVEATIEFISPLATEIDGVAYYKAILEFTETPTWIRAGLNADIDIIVNEVIDVLRVPVRFVDTERDAPTILRPSEAEPVVTLIEVGFTGNDGFIEVIGLNEGDVIVAP